VVVALAVTAGCNGDDEPREEERREEAAESPGPEWPGYELVRTLGEGGGAAGQLHMPMGVDVDSEGRVWIADTGNARVLVLGPDAAVVARIPRGDDGPELARPMDVTVVPDGTAWIADFATDRLLHVSLEGDVLGRESLPEGSAPAGACVLPDGRIAVAAFEGHRVHVLGPDGRRTSFGGEGGDSGALRYPTDVAALADGSLLVSDAYNHRIQRRAPGGEVGQSWPTPEGEPLRVPASAVVDGDVIHVADSERRRVVALDRGTGARLGEWNVEGEGRGGSHTPAHIVSHGGRIFVADPDNDRIVVLEPAGS